MMYLLNIIFESLIGSLLGPWLPSNIHRFDYELFFQESWRIRRLLVGPICFVSLLDPDLKIGVTFVTFQI